MSQEHDAWLRTLGVPEDSFDQDDSDAGDTGSQGDSPSRFIPGVLDDPVCPDPKKPRDCTSLSDSVGKGGNNDLEDVKAVQKELNRHLYMSLSLDGKCGSQTITAIKTFQVTMLGWPNPDSLVEPGKRTAKALAGPRIVGPAKPKAKPDLGTSEVVTNGASTVEGPTGNGGASGKTGGGKCSDPDTLLGLLKEGIGVAADIQTRIWAMDAKLVTIGWACRSELSQAAGDIKDTIADIQKAVDSIPADAEIIPIVITIGLIVKAIASAAAAYKSTSKAIDCLDKNGADEELTSAARDILNDINRLQDIMRRAKALIG